MFQKILVPVDGSNTAWRALTAAGSLADKFQGELLVLTVVEPYDAISKMSMNLDRVVMERTLRAMKKASQKVLGKSPGQTGGSRFQGHEEFVRRKAMRQN